MVDWKALIPLFSGRQDLCRKDMRKVFKPFIVARSSFPVQRIQPLQSLQFMSNQLLAISLCLLLLASCGKENSTAPSGKYYPKAKTIIQANCTVTCHSPSQGFMQGLPVVLETDSDIVQRAASIKAAVGDPVTPFNKRMPQGGSLSAADIATITQWYAAGGGTDN